MKKSIGSFLTVLMGVTALMLTSCATGEKSMQEHGLAPLTHNELETLMSGTTTSRWTSSKGVSGTGIYTQDGTAKLSWNGGGAEGSWRISGDKFCTKYATIRDGKETCFTMYKTGETEYKSFSPDGSLNAIVAFSH